jgi:chaperonin GroES
MKDSTPGGILLPDSAINKHQPTGVVICVGPGKRGRDGKYIAIDLEPGQRIIMSTYAGLEIRGELGAQDDQDYVIMREEDVQAVLAEE